MTQLEAGAIHRYRGPSTAPKPGVRADEETGTIQLPPVGSTFTETDTGRRFIWTREGQWERQEQTVETLLADLLDVNERILARLDATHRGHEEHLWEEEVEMDDL